MSSKRPGRRSVAVRIVALVLAGIMVLGMAYYIFLLIGGKI